MIQVDREFLLLHRHHAGQQVHVDALAFAGAIAVLKRGQDADDEMQARVLVGDGDRHQERRIAAPPGEPHRAGQRLHEIVLAGARDVGPVRP